LDAGGSVVATTATGASGSYSFTGLAAGSYAAQFTASSGFIFSPQDRGGDDSRDSDADPATGRTALVALAAGVSTLSVDAGLYRPASIGDFVWNDLDADGMQGGSEPGLPGVVVNLLRNGTSVASTTTGPDGLYFFDRLTPGDYVVEFVTPAGLTPSP